jgi:starch synthase
MFGIRNGIDQELWDPSIDEHLPQNYGPEDVVQGKAAAKRELRRRGNLADVDVPVVSTCDVRLAVCFTRAAFCAGIYVLWTPLM